MEKSFEVIADRDRHSYLVRTLPETPDLWEEAWVHSIADGDHQSYLVVPLPKEAWAHS